MRLFPKLPNQGFWQKWNLCCILFTGGSLLATRFGQNMPEVVEFAENLVLIGGICLLFGFIMQFWFRK